LVQEKISLLRDNEYHSANLILEESALASADKVDEKIKTGQTIGLLEGIPFGIKDVLLLQGNIASGGSAFLKNYTAPYTATAIQKLIDAGAIPVVKENCDSFGHGSTGENTAFGTVINAHDKSKVAGGSSGGSAVNVAKGYTVFSVGGDTGGSIPAGYNKVYSLKPTYGRVSRYGMMANVSSTDSTGPMASSLEDIRILINAMSGKDVHDQTTYSSTPIPENIFESKIAKVPIAVGYYQSFIENKYLDATIKTAFQKMLNTLSNQGIRVVPLDFFDVETLASTCFVLAMAETASNLARFDGTVYGARANNINVREGYMITRSENLPDETKRRITGGCQATSRQYDEDVYLKAKILKNKLLDTFNSDFEKVNLILSPVSMGLPPSIGQQPENPVSTTLSSEIGQFPENPYFSEAYSVAFNLGGLPTLTAPLFTPTGIQLTANKNREDLLLAFANHFGIISI
jgi:aspartyl-tRNA(Asn)/glutamyl-tRNA(Gln) amidotransferase subunit A